MGTKDILLRRSLGGAGGGTLVPLQEETSGSAPKNDIGIRTQTKNGIIVTKSKKER